MSTFEETMQKLSEPSKSGFQAQMELYTGQSDVTDEEETVDDIVPPPAPELSYLEENLDLPFGLAGATGGAIAGGMVAGPPGAVVGSVIGGAGGTLYGTAQSEQLKGSSTVEAYKEGIEAALWSVGIDLATMGILTKLKPAWYALRMRQGKSIEEAAQEAIDTVLPAGSPESLAATQRLLQARGATLLPSQVFRTGLDGFRERIASVGLISREKMADNIEAVNNALVEELNLLINKNASGMANDAYNMGSAFSMLIDEGVEVLRKQYGQGLDEINRALSTATFKTIDSRFLTNPIDSYLRTLTGEAADKVQPETLEFIRDTVKRIKDLESGQVRVSELLMIDKSFTNRANAAFGPSGSTRNTYIHKELQDAAEVIRQTILNTIERVDPKAAAEYKALKEAYRRSYNAMTPKVNEGFVRQADKGSYTSLGNIAAKGNRLEQIQALKKSLAEAYSVARKAGETLSVQSFGEVDKLFREGFLSEKLTKVLSGDVANVQQLRSLAIQLDNPSQRAIFKEVLGPDFARFNQLMNAIRETAESASGDTGALFLRGLEAKGAKGLGNLLKGGIAPGAAVVGGTAAGAAGLGIGIGAAALYIPNVFAKVVTNPQYVNKLIAALSAGGKTRASADVAMNIMVSEIIDEMSEGEREMAMKYLEQQLAGMLTSETPQ